MLEDKLDALAKEIANLAVAIKGVSELANSKEVQTQPEAPAKPAPAPTKQAATKPASATAKATPTKPASATAKATPGTTKPTPAQETENEDLDSLLGGSDEPEEKPVTQEDIQALCFAMLRSDREKYRNPIRQIITGFGVDTVQKLPEDKLRDCHNQLLELQAQA